jgi:hypothetical protein
MKLSTLFATGILCAAVLLSAWNGSLNWMGIAIFAVIMKLPGTGWIKGIFKGKQNVDGS